MSCPPFTYDAAGRRGLGVVQPHSGIDYPFVTPSEEIRYLFADFFFAYEEPADYDPALTPRRLPLQIAWVYGLGCVENTPPDWAPTPTHTADLVLKDADGTIVFDSTTADYFAETVWNTVYRIYEWRKDGDTCRIVVHTAWNDNGYGPSPRNYSEHIEPDRAVLDVRTTVRIPPRVKSLSAILETIARQQATLAAGYNIKLEVEDLGFRQGRRRQTRITVSAVPGAGLGRYADCAEEDPPLRKLQGVTPDAHGDVYIAATDCYSVRQPTTVVNDVPRRLLPSRSLDHVSPHLIIANSCKTPCCDCVDFIAAAEYLNQLRDEYKALADRVIAARDVYHENRSRWLAAAACREGQALQVTVVPQTGPFVDIAGQFTNQTNECITNVAIQFELSATPAVTPELVCGTTLIWTSLPRAEGVPYVLQGEWSTYRAYFEAVKPGDSVRVRFRLKFPTVGLSADGEPFAVTATLTGSANGQTVGSAVPPTKTATLNSIDESC